MMRIVFKINKAIDQSRVNMRLQKKDQKKIIKKDAAQLSFKRKISFFLHQIWFWFKCCMIVLIITAISFYHSGITNFCLQKFYSITCNLGFKVENIVIQDRKSASITELLSIAGVIKDTPIFAVDIHSIKSNLENYSWIKEALVVRKLPDTIHIKVVEKAPVAIWQKDQKLNLIDSDGEIIINADIHRFNDLLHVVGDDANIYAISLIQAIPFEFFSNIKSAVRFGNRRWNLILKDETVVKLPENNAKQAIEYLMNLNKENKLFNSNIKMLDLRNEQKYYIEYGKPEKLQN